MAAKKKQPASQKSEKGQTLAAAESSAADNVKDQPAALHIVGVGASAGGLEALNGFFGAMPADCAMAFVVVQHLDPHHKSLLKNLLAKKTDLEVQDASAGVAVKPNRVYLKPPGKDIVCASSGSLRPSPRSSISNRWISDITFIENAQVKYRDALSYSKKTTAAHLGGKVRLESTPGGGSAFFVEIPRQMRG